MNVSSNMSSSSMSTVSTPKAHYSAQEVNESTLAPERDGDSDDHNVSRVQASSPTRNLSGQSIGQRINVVA
ncbi:hypothetical protein [Marinomonas spartinae]|uniref:hypothetical protein n=1 Tax=Marinomonas spartinae TaxID=1792290 RepID=UPI0018F11046|nr:hypothetical protein [Marinomonas spartinae]MBJ7554336.1 hypothetical protein [Marinomonas spartinae]